MRVMIFQHVPFEGIGTIGAWLDAHAARVDWTRFHRGDGAPRSIQCDLLIVMGGPMGAHQDESYPWLAGEKRAIREAIEGGARVLGVCLGAQLIAAALGARVFPGREREIGWHPVLHAPGIAGNPFADAVPDGALVFHWHGDTFDLPRGATRLLSSEGCANQAFLLGGAVLGLQFHLETTPELAAALIENCRHDLAPGRFVQDEAQIRGEPRRFADLAPAMGRVLDVLVGAASAAALPPGAPPATAGG